MRGPRARRRHRAVATQLILGDVRGGEIVEGGGAGGGEDGGFGLRALAEPLQEAALGVGGVGGPGAFAKFAAADGIRDVVAVAALVDSAVASHGVLPGVRHSLCGRAKSRRRRRSLRGRTDLRVSEGRAMVVSGPWIPIPNWTSR